MTPDRQHHSEEGVETLCTGQRRIPTAQEEIYRIGESLRSDYPMSLEHEIVMSSAVPKAF
jgi:hypothetical protein